MSGPKVVRIVTREEIEAICRRHIAGVAVAAAEARRRADRCERLDASLERALSARVEAFEAMFRRRAWMGIQKGAPEAIAFIRAEADRVEAAATAAAATARTRSRRVEDAARSVAACFEAAGVPAPTGLLGAAEGRSASLDEAERQVTSALAHLTGGPGKAVALAQQVELAARLSEGERTTTLAGFVASRTAEPTASEQRLDALLAELGVLGGGADAFAARARAVACERDASRRALLTDSLILDAAAAVGALRRREAAVQDLREAAASLAGFSSPRAKTLSGRLLAAAAKGNDRDADVLVQDARSLLTIEARAAAAAARRQAVLAGLAQLGYEVRETMAAAWEQDGRIVVRKPGVVDYGLEVGAPPDAAKLQVRVVGSDQPVQPRTSRRDADQETIWCGEFERLQAGLAEGGSELVLERALAPGEQALRTVAMPHADPVRETALPGRLRQQQKS